MKDVQDLTGDEWANVIEVWDAAGEALDEIMEQYASHRELDNCAHPACTGTWLAQFLNTVDARTAAMLLHVAMNRLEVARLEKEMEE